MGAKDRLCLHALIEYCYWISTTAYCNYAQIMYAPNAFCFVLFFLLMKTSIVPV